MQVARVALIYPRRLSGAVRSNPIRVATVSSLRSRPGSVQQISCC